MSGTGNILMKKWVMATPSMELTPYFIITTILFYPWESQESTDKREIAERTTKINYPCLRY